MLRRLMHLLRKLILPHSDLFCINQMIYKYFSILERRDAHGI